MRGRGRHGGWRAAELPGRCRVPGCLRCGEAVADVPLADTLARPLRDLRISVTDRCQFRCTYCMPREVFGRDVVFLPRGQAASPSKS